MLAGCLVRCRNERAEREATAVVVSCYDYYDGRTRADRTSSHRATSLSAQSRSSPRRRSRTARSPSGSVSGPATPFGTTRSPAPRGRPPPVRQTQKKGQTANLFPCSATTRSGDTGARPAWASKCLRIGCLGAAGGTRSEGSTSGREGRTRRISKNGGRTKADDSTRQHAARRWIPRLLHIERPDQHVRRGAAANRPACPPSGPVVLPRPPPSMVSFFFLSSFSATLAPLASHRKGRVLFFVQHSPSVSQDEKGTTYRGRKRSPWERNMGGSGWNFKRTKTMGVNGSRFVYPLADARAPLFSHRKENE